jgi:exodeoxyribonuclease VII large subunit
MDIDTMPGLLAQPSAGDNSPPLSVGELSGALKRTIELAFDKVRVRGEISGFKRHASGHCYFTLKDDTACMDAVIWRSSAGALAFRPEDGAEVIATGKLTTYPGRSKYQIMVERLELAGEGALMALLDRRRRALAAEGLFDASAKRPLPFLPQVIGVVTSPTGAVIRDILHRLADRCPTRVIVWPVPVQGEGAAARVAAAIRGFGALEPGGPVPRPDLAYLGGGPRDRHHADRPCVRPSRADSDGGGRTRRSCPVRTARAACRTRPPLGCLPHAQGGPSPRAVRSYRVPLAGARGTVRTGCPAH